MLKELEDENMKLSALLCEVQYCEKHYAQHTYCRHFKNSTIIFKKKKKHSAGKQLLLISVFLQCAHKAYLDTLFLNDAVPTHTLC